MFGAAAPYLVAISAMLFSGLCARRTACVEEVARRGQTVSKPRPAGRRLGRTFASVDVASIADRLTALFYRVMSGHRHSRIDSMSSP